MCAALRKMSEQLKQIEQFIIGVEALSRVDLPFGFANYDFRQGSPSGTPRIPRAGRARVSTIRHRLQVAGNRERNHSTSKPD